MEASYGLRSPTVADAERLAEVHLRSWQTAYRGIFPEAWLDGWRARLGTRTENWRQGLAQPDPPGSATVLVETMAGELVGFASAGPRRDAPAGPTDGELYAIYLLAEHRGSGQGRRLFHWCARHLHALGCTTMMLWVIDRNPTCGFYAAMGGSVIPNLTMTAAIAGIEVREIAYGWATLPLGDDTHR